MVTSTTVPQDDIETVTHRARVVWLSAAAGLAIAVLWSARFVDDTIGMTVADGILGTDASTASITSTIAGLVFAFTTGLAGTFTACNVAVFSALAPMVESRPSLAGRITQALRPLGWVTLGAVVVAGGYGAIGAILGNRLPQLSTVAVSPGEMSPRLIQSVVVFGVIGLIMLYLGLAALRVVPDPFARLTARWAPTPQVVMGVLIGGFIIGRPWGLFRKMFQQAADTHNALYGAATFVLLVVGNIVVMGLLFLLLSFTRLPRWLRAKPSRIAVATAAALIVGGVFTFVYWDIRLPARFGFGWFPMVPWR